MTIKNRLEKLERKLWPLPPIEKVYGLRDDGTRWPIETWLDFALCRSELFNEDGQPMDEAYNHCHSTLVEALDQMLYLERNDEP